MYPLPLATSADERQRAASVAILPIGSFEQHGRHLPLSTDTIIASAIASSVADAYDLFLLPPITISCSQEHVGWSGTTSIRAATLIQVVSDIAESLRHSGIVKLVLVNGHGGNYVLSNIVQEANVGESTMALYPTRQDWDAARLAANLASTGHDDMHAGEIETSLLLHVIPESVAGDFASQDHTTERPYLLTLGMRGYTKNGVIGRPSLGSADKGAIVLSTLTIRFSETLRMLGESASNS